MEETLRKLDELALEVKLMTTKMRERGPVEAQRLDETLYQMRVLLVDMQFYKHHRRPRRLKAAAAEGKKREHYEYT
jgi:hypothetical protein